jgi:hypothetical protein
MEIVMKKYSNDDMVDIVYKIKEVIVEVRAYNNYLQRANKAQDTLLVVARAINIEEEVQYNMLIELVSRAKTKESMLTALLKEIEEMMHTERCGLANNSKIDKDVLPGIELLIKTRVQIITALKHIRNSIKNCEDFLK